MAKSIGKGINSLMGGSSSGAYKSDKDLLNYLNNYDTTNVDNTYKNLAQSAYNLSNTLSSRPDYIYSVDGSDAARQRMENAVYQSAVDKITPDFDNRRSQLETRLQNQGLSVGSEAYQRAMNDLEEEQNNAYNQAAYQSVIQGQNAFTNSLNNQINAANFQNNTRNNVVNEILNMLNGSYSGYDVNMDKYKVQSGVDARNAQIDANNAQAGASFLGSAITTGLMAAFSDEELKENLYPVGKLFNGLTVYLYNYKGDNVPQIGLLAQEVAFMKPEAVFVDESGYLKINYALACR